MAILIKNLYTDIITLPNSLGGTMITTTTIVPFDFDYVVQQLVINNLINKVSIKTIANVNTTTTDYPTISSILGESAGTNIGWAFRSDGYGSGSMQPFQENIHNTITVGISGDTTFTSIKVAIQTAIDGGASGSNRWIITVDPGHYMEDPMTIPDGVMVSSHNGGIGTVVIIANNPNENLITMLGGFLTGVRLQGVLDPLKALVRCSLPNVVNTINTINIGHCSNGIWVENGAKLRCNGIDVFVNNVNSSIGTLLYISGDSTQAVFSEIAAVVSSTVSTMASQNLIQKVVYATNNAFIGIGRMQVDITPFDNTQTVIAIDNGASSLVQNFFIQHAAIPFYILAGGENSRIVVQNGHLIGNELNFKIDSSTGVIFESGIIIDEENNQIVEGGILTGIVQELDNSSTELTGNVLVRFGDNGRELSLPDFLIDQQGSGVVSGGDVTDAGGLNVDVQAGAGWIRRNSPEDLLDTLWDSTTLTGLPTNSTVYVYIDEDTLIPSYSTSAISEEKIGLAIVITGATAIRFIHEIKLVGEDVTDLIQAYLLNTRKFTLGNGLGTTQGTTIRRINVETGNYYMGLALVDFIGTGTDDTIFSYFYGADGYTEIANVQDLDIIHYDNSGTLASMIDGYYRVDDVFITSDSRVSINYGIAQYSTLNNAQESLQTNPPSFINPSAYSVARIVIKQGIGINNIIDGRVIASAHAGTVPITDHGQLTGLADDDHPQYLPADGSRAMGADLDMANNAIINAEQINGVVPEDHSARHNPGGIDAISTGIPSIILVGANTAEGSSSSLARADHQHGIATGTPQTIGTTNLSGSSSSVARLDHVHAHGNLPGGLVHDVVIANGLAGFISGADKAKLDASGILSSSTPAILHSNVAANAGVATDVARSDHSHGIATDVVITIGTINAIGASTSLARADHVHAHGIQTDGTLHSTAIASGASGFMSGSDKFKLDGISAGATNLLLSSTSPLNIDKSSTLIGTSITAARSDHKHDITTDVPNTISASNIEGVSSSLSRADHIHSHGNLGGGSTHSLVIANSSAGFMSGTDKAKLDSLPTNPAITSINLTAGAGLTGGGDLSQNRTFNIIANADASIVVNTDDIQLGTIGFSRVQAALASASSTININNQSLTGLGNPVNPTDAVNKQYTDSVATGLNVKSAAIAATTTNIDLSAGGLLTIDTITVVDGYRVLVKDQTSPKDNGIYIAHSGSWTRATDANSSAQVTNGIFVFITNGSINLNTGWILNTPNPIILGTTSLSFAQFSGTGNLIAGNGLTQTGVTFNVIANADGSIISNANDIQVGILASDAQHGNRGGGGLHSNVTSSVAGFMSSADKTKLDGLPSSAAPTSRALIAGAGLVGGGDLSSDRTFNISANADGSIVVNADDIQVGILASDAQHGNRGGGGLHSNVTGTTAGFMSSSDKTKIDGIASGATNSPLSSVSPLDVDRNIASIGVSTSAARADHKHNISTAITTNSAVVIGNISSEGTATSLARSDHQHAVLSGTPTNTSNANNIGVASTFARSDHTHQTQIDATHIALVNTITTASTTDVVLTSMTLTPGAGNWMAMFSCNNFNASATASNTFSIYLNGVQITATERTIRMNVANASAPISIMCLITGALAGQAIDVRWRVSANTGTTTNRELILVRTF